MPKRLLSFTLRKQDNNALYRIDMKKTLLALTPGLLVIYFAYNNLVLVCVGVLLGVMGSMMIKP